IVVRAVAIAFAIGLVVLAVVGDQIVERETVVAGDEIHALLRVALLMSIDLRTAHQAIREPGNSACVAAKEAAKIVAEASIPLAPTVAQKTSHLINPRRVPRLRDKLGAHQPRIGLDVP